MGRKTITVSEDVFDRLEDLKDDGESWTDLGERAADALEGQDGDVNAAPNADQPLTEEHIDDIAAEVERRFERTLENSLTTR